MNEAQARSAMLVRAIELSDSTHAVWGREDRQWATDTAIKDTPGVAATGKRAADREARAFIARRAALACARLERDHPEIGRVQRAVRWPAWVWWLLPIGAFALGVASNALGADRRINIISFPLLGVLAWNLVVYVAMIAGAAAGYSRRRGAARSGLIARLHARLARRAAPARAAGGPLERGLAQFVADWLAAASRLNNARTRAALHLSAALLAFGAVAGMYVRGLGFEYLAGWESTFLSGHAVHRMLAAVLGPAAALSGITIPGPEHIAVLRWSPAQMGEGAARWIHLYALTAALFVILPRLALALFNTMHAWRLERTFVLPLDEDRYFRRLLARRSGEPTLVRVIPYSYTPDARSQEALRDVLAEAFDGPVQTEFQEPIPYGGEDDYLASAAHDSAGAPECFVVLFNMSATPEDENHGILVARLQAAQRGAQRLLAVVNESPYRQRLAGQAAMPSRLAQRREAWEAVLRGRGVRWVALDLEADDTAAAARRVETVMREPALSGSTA